MHVLSQFHSKQRLVSKMQTRSSRPRSTGVRSVEGVDAGHLGVSESISPTMRGTRLADSCVGILKSPQINRRKRAAPTLPSERLLLKRRLQFLSVKTQLIVSLTLKKLKYLAGIQVIKQVEAIKYPKET